MSNDKKNILIVEDDPDSREVLLRIVENLGYRVLGFGSGKEALEGIKDAQVDLALLDIMMPEMSGIQALKEIKERYPESRIIMSASMGQQNLVVEAIRAGAADFFIKPVQAEKVVEAIEKALRHKNHIFATKE